MTAVAVIGKDAGTTTAGFEVRGKMKRSKMEKTIKQLLKMEQKIRFDLAIQRNTVWSDMQKSMLIHSILDEYPIPLLFIASSDDGFFWMLDGKQRLTTIFDFLSSDEERMFALSKDTPPVYVEKEIEVDGEMKTVVQLVEVEGKKFRELDKELQDQILDYSLTLVEMKNITQEQCEELFQRLNAGSPLTQMELTRALSGGATMSFINEVSANQFFVEFAAISTKARNRYVDQELVMQVLMLMMGRESGISSKEIKEFAMDLREVGIDDTLKAEMYAVTEYLQEAFKKLDEDDKKNKALQNKILKKIHIPMLFLTAQELIRAGVSPVDFGKWALEFFTKEYKSGSGEYGVHCVSGSAKVKAVKGRLEAMKKSAYKHFQISAESLVAATKE